MTDQDANGLAAAFASAMDIQDAASEAREDATQAERKRCVSVNVELALEARTVRQTLNANSWAWQFEWTKQKAHMQAAREIMPKVQSGSG